MFNDDQKKAIFAIADAYAELLIFQKTGRALNAVEKVLAYQRAAYVAGIEMISEAELNQIKLSAINHDKQRGEAIRRSRAKVVSDQ